MASHPLTPLWLALYRKSMSRSSGLRIRLTVELCEQVRNFVAYAQSLGVDMTIERFMREAVELNLLEMTVEYPEVTQWPVRQKPLKGGPRSREN